MTRRDGRLALEAALARRGLGPVAGVDEAETRLHPDLADLDDSKKLTAATRERLHDVILRRASAVSVVVIEPDRIDMRGIHRCNLEGMRRAVAALDPAPGFVLTDGFAVDGLGCQSTSVIGGDAVVASIAAASVLAKVTRDRIMVDRESRQGDRAARSQRHPSDVVRQRPSRRAGAFEEQHEMSAEDLENYETEMELSLYREYRDIVGQFTYVVETERRFYLANAVELIPRSADGEVYFDVRMSDAWVWDMYRPARFVKYVRVLTFKDVNIEELDKPELRLPE